MSVESKNAIIKPTGKRHRESPQGQAASHFTPSPNSKKICTATNVTSPLTPCSGFSMGHSVARSILTAGSKRPAPPPPPNTPPPRPTEIVKILCLGSEASTRRTWILNLAKRHKVLDDNKLAEGSAEIQKEGPCSLEYHKKDYSFLAASGEERAVRMQFLHLHGTPSNKPPKAWGETRHKIHSALLIADLRHIVSLWESDGLEVYLSRWRALVDNWTSARLSFNLLLANVTHEPHTIPPAILLRVGAALARLCPQARLDRWFLVGPEEESLEGLDSIDAVLQSLVEQATSNRSGASVTRRDPPTPANSTVSDAKSSQRGTDNDVEGTETSPCVGKDKVEAQAELDYGKGASNKINGSEDR